MFGRPIMKQTLLELLPKRALLRLWKIAKIACILNILVVPLSCGSFDSSHFVRYLALWRWIFEGNACIANQERWQRPPWHRFFESQWRQSRLSSEQPSGLSYVPFQISQIFTSVYVFAALYFTESVGHRLRCHFASTRSCAWVCDPLVRLQLRLNLQMHQIHITNSSWCQEKKVWNWRGRTASNLCLIRFCACT